MQMGLQERKKKKNQQKTAKNRKCYVKLLFAMQSHVFEVDIKRNASKCNKTFISQFNLHLTMTKKNSPVN